MAMLGPWQARPRRSSRGSQGRYKLSEIAVTSLRLLTALRINKLRIFHPSVFHHVEIICTDLWERINTEEISNSMQLLKPGMIENEFLG